MIYTANFTLHGEFRDSTSNMCDDRVIYKFFEKMCEEHLNKEMLKYIKLENLRHDFIREVRSAIDQMALSEGKGVFLETSEICSKVPFWLNQFEMCDQILEAEDKIWHFVERAARGNLDEDDEVENSDQNDSKPVDAEALGDRLKTRSVAYPTMCEKCADLVAADEETYMCETCWSFCCAGCMIREGLCRVCYRAN